MKPPEIPGAIPGNVLRLAEPRLTKGSPVDETPALPKGHRWTMEARCADCGGTAIGKLEGWVPEDCPGIPIAHVADFGEDALATARNAEMVRDLAHGFELIRAHEAWWAAQPRVGRVLHITVPDKYGDWRYDLPDGIREVRVSVRGQPAPFARFMGVDIYADASTKPGDLRLERAGPLLTNKDCTRYVQPMRFRFTGHDDLPRRERQQLAYLDCIEIAAMKGSMLSCDEVNRIRANYGLEPVAESPDERWLSRLWAD